MLRYTDHMIRVIHSRCFLTFFISLLFVGGYRSGAQLAKPNEVIYLKNGNLVPEANAGRYLDSLIALGGEHEPIQVMIHFAVLPDAHQKEVLEQNGVTLLEYVPDNTFTALLHMPINKENILSTPVHSFVAMRPEWKAGDYVWRRTEGKKGSVEVLVSFCAAISDREIRQFVAGLGGAINTGAWEKYGAYKVIMAGSLVKQLAGWYGVRYISPVTDIVPLDLQSRPAVKGNIAVASPLHGGYGLTGDSVTVGVGDNASGIYHIDLKERITNFNPGKEAHHGEHVNGIVGGAAIVDPLAASMAPHVSLIDYLYDQILPAVGTMYQDHHMTITNNSYEVVAADCDYSGVYDVYSQFLDTLAIQYPEVQNVFASGNDGWMHCSPFPQGFATVGGGYQPAKNNIVVGSMTDFQIEAGDESRGPVRDGRLKPEIVATGLGAYSTIGVDQYAWAAGTSMASPQVAGGMAILTQRYKQLTGNQPRADVLKAILLNGAMELGNPGPDFTYGFGVMDVTRSLKIIDDAHYATNIIANADSQSFTISVPANTAQLKVMLVWNDVPASAVSAKQLVNDLDISVKDPSSAWHLPLVLDHSPANVSKNATEQVDHLNNTEQVTITNPAAGTYTIHTKGYNVPYGPQRYAVAYDIIPKGVFLTFPIGGEQLSNSRDPFDSTRVFWNAISDGNTFTVQLSQDNGGIWTTIDNNVPADIRRCDFIASGINSGNCIVRVLRNGTSEVATSQRFTINDVPIAGLDTAQCPGYLSIHWSPIINATGYYLLKKVGKYMQLVDSVPLTDTVYTFSNMPLTINSYVAVQPIIEGMPGYRSNAVIAKANSGNCTRPVSFGDLMIEAPAGPIGGRMHTSTEINVGTVVKVKVRNLYTAPTANYTLSFQVNAGPWQTLTNPGVIPANRDTVIGLAGAALATPGVYHFRTAIHNIGAFDPNVANDTIDFTVTSLVNDTVNLSVPFTDGFEAMPVITASHDTIGVSPNSHWDFSTTNEFGRMRSFVSSDITITGTRAVSLDQDQNIASGCKNTFTGTFNLSNYDTANAEVRVDFDYMLHGRPKSADGNQVSMRGVDTLALVPVYYYDLSAYPGTVTHVKSLSLTDVLRQTHSNFSPSCQVAFGQSDTSLIAAPTYGNGMTLDNFRLYTVANDVAMVGVVSPLPSNCGLSSPQPLVVQIHNGVNYTLHNVQVFYKVDGGTTFTGIIDSIKAKATISYTFAQQLDMTINTTHSLDVWLSVAGDTYNGNDSILNYRFRNNKIITSFPYLENFELGDGGYYSDGFKNSWQFGTPVSQKINKAASGTKAWKTNLAGHYNNLEVSYLYTPCFDISQLANPKLSFSVALDIENCGNALCDAAFVEVSFDGNTWTRLGSVGQGTNWYDSTFNVWNSPGFTRWHVASVPIPQAGAGATTHFRFVLHADPGVTFEGIALDDIHVYDLEQGIHPAQGVKSVSNSLTQAQWTNYVLDNQLLAAVAPTTAAISNASVTLYEQDTLYNPGATQFTFPRSYNIQSPQAVTDSSGVRLFLTEDDMLRVVNDTTCPSCNRITDAYSLGITQYNNPDNRTMENGSLVDDSGGLFNYYPYKAIKWVPYDNGYYAQLKVKPLSELWFNDGGPTGNFNAATDYLNFVAYRNGTTVTNSWYSLIDTVVDIYTPQWSIDSVNFADIISMSAKHLPVASYSIDDPVNFPKYPIFFFRLKWTMTTDDLVHYSPVRRVDFSDSAITRITLDARMTDHKHVMVSWTSFIDGVVDHYVLDRSNGSSPYFTVNKPTALHRYGQSYSYPDEPGDLPTGTIIHYRLTAVMMDGTSVVLPERTVEWINGNQVVDIYPNPTHDGRFTINWNADAGTLMNITMTDAAGHDVYVTGVLATQWNNTTTIQGAQLPKGVYFVRLIIDGRKYVRKIVYL